MFVVFPYRNVALCETQNRPISGGLLCTSNSVLPATLSDRRLLNIQLVHPLRKTTAMSRSRAIYEYPNTFQLRLQVSDSVDAVKWLQTTRFYSNYHQGTTTLFLVTSSTPSLHPHYSRCRYLKAESWRWIFPGYGFSFTWLTPTKIITSFNIWENLHTKCFKTTEITHRKNPLALKIF